jgi:Ca2+-transporting ATPase
VIRRTSALSAILGAVLSPVPFADEVALVPIYGLLARRLSKIHGLALRTTPWRPMTVSTVKGLAARGVVNFGASFVPGVDAVVFASTAAALTEILGNHYDQACTDPAEARTLEFRSLVSTLSSRMEARRFRANRARLEVRGLLGKPQRKAAVEQSLAKVPGVVEAKASTRSGRVLVRTSRPVSELRDLLDEAIRTSEDPHAPLPPSGRRTLAAMAQKTEALAATVRAAWKRRSVGAPARELPAAESWHAMPLDQVIEKLGGDLRRGLTTQEASRRLRAKGANVLAGVDYRGGLDILLGEIFTVPTAMLAAAIALSLLAGDVIEGAAIALVLGSNLVIEYLTESRAEELLGAWGKLRAELATVVRDGRASTIKASELVPGDLVVLRAGQQIAADARVVDASDFSTDESMLTGESDPVEKSPAPSPENAPLAERSSVVYSGSVVSTGCCKAVVCATGYGTWLGALERSLSHAEQRTAPLERQLATLGRTLASSSIASAAVVTIIGLLRGQPARQLLRTAVALGVAAIPEGIPTVGTTALALASRRLQREGLVIRRLAAAETLGALSVICADKTGTLTENRMRIAEILLPSYGVANVDWSNGHFAVHDGNGRPIAERELHDLARIAALNADVEIDESGSVATASGTERALVEFAIAAGYPVQSRRKAAKRIGEQRRSAESPVMLTIHEHPELGRIELAKGAPEEVLARCGDLEPDRIGQLAAANDAMASRGLRVLGFAWRRVSNGALTFAGFVGLRDPPRPHVREALAALHDAGITTYMLTGDQRRTALAIGNALGIAETSIFSRVTPEAKLEIVQQIQGRGAVVAMTGDGVNDGPALKAADVGIAMGERGTDLARAVADVVLAHDDLPSLVQGVSEGRTLYDNVRRAIDYLVATNMSEVLVAVAGAIFGASPLLPLQLLWINILTDVAPGLALAVEPSEQDAMQRPPRDPGEPLFDGGDAWRLGKRAGRMAAAALAMFGIGRLEGRDEQYASTMTFTSLVTAQLLETNHHRARSSRSNPDVAWVLGAGALLQAVAIGNRSVRSMLGNAALGTADAGISIALGLLAARDGLTLLWLPREEIVKMPRSDLSLRSC